MLIAFRPLEVAVDGVKQGVTKKRRSTKEARLQICKIELFRTFVRIAGCDSAETYFAVKSKASEYQRGWNKVKEEVFKVWTFKDKALLDFCID